MEEKKKQTINEDYIMSMVSDTYTGNNNLKHDESRIPKKAEDEYPNAKEAISAEPDRESKQVNRKNKKRKNWVTSMEYKEEFIKKAYLSARSGKAVYIRDDFHNSINRIISIVANNEISITDYLDNILSHHFELFEQEITDLFDKNYKPIIINKK